MRFLPYGPDIPNELITAQESGQIIFVCGAGVSYPVGLPLFKGLVEGVYEKLGEDWDLHSAEREGMREGGRLYGQYDRVLRCLERRLGASDSPRNRGMRERILVAVRDLLVPPNDADLANHLALLKLSRDREGSVRLLTTNFDTLFERAWFGESHSSIESHAGSAMPQPKTARCTGVLHLHGRLADPRSELGISETDLVLTSAEFGDAYMRQGWASRYVYDLVRAYTVVLVGYQADDPPMRYLLEALEADRERFLDLQKVYAFAPCENGKEKLEHALWQAKAVEPILYSANKGDHSSLYDSLREWRHYADDPTAWRRERLRAILSESPGSLPDARIKDCAALLSHGDASQLLGELHQLVSPDFQPFKHPPLEEILRAWPKATDDEAALFRSLDRALMDALEESSDAGFLDGADRASWNVPSVAPHSQNAYCSGFYPITRALADLWNRIVVRDRDLARTFALRWADSNFFSSLSGFGCLRLCMTSSRLVR